MTKKLRSRNVFFISTLIPQCYVTVDIGYVGKIPKIGMCTQDCIITPQFSTEVETIECILKIEVHELSIDLEAKMSLKM